MLGGCFPPGHITVLRRAAPRPPGKRGSRGSCHLRLALSASAPGDFRPMRVPRGSDPPGGKHWAGCVSAHRSDPSHAPHLFSSPKELSSKVFARATAGSLPLNWGRLATAWMRCDIRLLRTIGSVRTINSACVVTRVAPQGTYAAECCAELHVIQLCQCA